MVNTLYYGDNLSVLRESIRSETVDLIYLDPPFNSNASYNVLFKSPQGQEAAAQIQAFDDTWHWGESAEEAYSDVLRSGNAAAAAFLLAAFYINGASFLGYAIMAEKRGIETRAQGEKSLYYSAGLLEGTETIVFFVILCLWPGAFVALAVIFGVLCLFTTGARLALARRVFR